MATIIREVNPSRPTANMDGRFTGEREFVVYDDATPSNFNGPDKVIAILGGYSPSTGESLPNFGEQFPNIGDLRAIDYDGPMQEPGNPYLWRIKWKYIRTKFTPGQIRPNEPGYVEINYSATMIVEDAWRMNPGLVFPTNGIPPTPNDLDVRGVSIDSCGEPASALILQQHLDVVNVVVGNLLPPSPLSIVGKRNAEVIFGAGIGRLVYVGITASTQLDTGIFSYTHRMTWDGWYHMRQRVTKSSSGEPNKMTIDGLPVSSDWVAETVKWYQPFPELAQFAKVIKLT